MALLNVCIYPDPILREKARPVGEVDRALRKLIDDMVETMYDAPGIGLAANQVGRPLRLIVVDLQKKDEDDHGLIVLINPEIVRAEGQITWEEGCLSVPEYYSKIRRAETVAVRGRDVDGNTLTIDAQGLLAVVLQHEIDHLEGKLFIDRMNPVRRDLFKRKWKKRLKEKSA